MQIIRKLILFSLFLTLLFPSCTKEYGYLAGIVFTIDDGNVNFWYPYLDYLDSLHFKLTFYVTDIMNSVRRKKTMLKNFWNHGHEIAYHTTNHVKISEFLEKKNG